MRQLTVCGGQTGANPRLGRFILIEIGCSPLFYLWEDNIHLTRSSIYPDTGVQIDLNYKILLELEP